jgi:hypothetical protein
MTTSPALSTSDVVLTIVRVVAPYVGETMARSAARAHCQKLGIAGDRMQPAQAEALIGKVGAGLNVFVGRDKSAAVVSELRRAIAAQAPPS